MNKNYCNINHNKAQMNQSFIFILSIIMVVFAGFLVTKFIYSFMVDTDKVLENKFYDKFEKDYTSVYTTYGSEEILKYKVTSQIKSVCFISAVVCIDNLDETIVSQSMKEDFKVLFGDAGDNVIMLNSEGISNSRKIISKNGDGFIVDTDDDFDTNDCLCITPKQGYFSLFMENSNNDVYLINVE